MSGSKYCYHCGVHHAAEEMRKVESKGYVRYRCIKSIAAGKLSRANRDAFGQRVTSANRESDRMRASRIHLKTKIGE